MKVLPVILGSLAGFAIGTLYGKALDDKTDISKRMLNFDYDECIRRCNELDVPHECILKMISDKVIVNDDFFKSDFRDIAYAFMSLDKSEVESLKYKCGVSFTEIVSRLEHSGMTFSEICSLEEDGIYKEYCNVLSCEMSEIDIPDFKGVDEPSSDMQVEQDDYDDAEDSGVTYKSELESFLSTYLCNSSVVLFLDYIRKMPESTFDALSHIRSHINTESDEEVLCSDYRFVYFLSLGLPLRSIAYMPKKAWKQMSELMGTNRR